MGSSPIKRGLLSAEGLEALMNQEPEECDYALIGKIALQLTGLEYQLETLVWYYMEDVDKGHIATARIGPIGKTDILATLVEWIEPDDGVSDAINWAIQSFHTLRENRNSIIHGFNFKADRKAGKLMIERRTKSLVFDAFQRFEINRKVLEQVHADQQALAMYIWRLERLLKMRPTGSIGPNVDPPTQPLRLPDKPSQPKKLTPLDFEAAKSVRRLRRERAEADAKRAKIERKNRQRQAARGTTRK